MGDSTSIWVAQLVGTEVRLLDYYENHGVGLDHYVKWIKDNDYLKDWDDDHKLDFVNVLNYGDTE
jgi:hypothetical protein